MNAETPNSTSRAHMAWHAYASAEDTAREDMEAAQ